MSAAELAGGFDVPTATSVSGHIEDRYVRRINAPPRADTAADVAGGRRPDR